MSSRIAGRTLPLALLLAPLVLAAPVRVSVVGQHALAPEIAVGAGGDVAIVWLDRTPREPAPAPAVAAGPSGPQKHDSSMDLWFARSVDGGRSFGTPVRVNPQAGSVWGFVVSKARVAVGRSGTFHVAYPGNDTDPALGKPILTMQYARSVDGGRSFEPPRRLNSLPGTDKSDTIDGGFAAADAFGTLGVAPDGVVHAIWVDTRGMTSGEGSAMAYEAVSRDDGRSWSPDSVVLATDVCPCCQLTLAFDAAGRMYLGSRIVTADGYRNSTVALLDRHGGPAGPRRPVFARPWRLDGCPLKPTAVAVDGRSVYAAAFSGAEEPAGAYLAVSRDGGNTFGPSVPLHPDALVSDAPVIAAVRGHAVFAWHAKTAGIRRVFWRSAERNGARLGPVVELEAPAGTAQSPALAARPDGRFQIAWQQGDEIMTATLDPAAHLRTAAP